MSTTIDYGEFAVTVAAGPLENGVRFARIEAHNGLDYAVALLPPDKVEDLRAALLPFGRPKDAGVYYTQAELDTIVEAERLTERRAVVAWLRDHASGYVPEGQDNVGAELLAHDLAAKANRIECGDHRG